LSFDGSHVTAVGDFVTVGGTVTLHGPLVQMTGGAMINVAGSFLNVNGTLTGVGVSPFDFTGIDNGVDGDGRPRQIAGGDFVRVASGTQAITIANSTFAVGGALLDLVNPSG